MKKVLKNRIFQFIITAIIFTSIGVVATNSINASNVSYKGETLDKALDTLYQRSTYTEYNGSVNITPTPTEQVLSTNNKVLKSNIIINPIPSNYKELNGIANIDANKIISGYSAFDNNGDLVNGTYIENITSSDIKFLGKNSIIGNTTMTYTITESVNLGIVVVTGSNNTDDTSYYTAEIMSLSNGNYREINNETVSFILSKDIQTGHRSRIYVIDNVQKGAVLTVATRYAGLMQIIKIK